MMRQILPAVGLGVVVLAQSGASAAAQTSKGPELLPALSLGGDAEDALTLDADLTDFDLEELLNIEVTVVSRRAESLDGAAAAVYVITGEEIRRAGHTSIQEALRMVPGTFVSHWRSSDWDVTMRGFGPGVSDTSQAYLNQVLVMLDGVVVYTPLYAGTWWGLQDIDLANVDRIEVIRGPSGILWGANAFHGLVNVVTKEASQSDRTRLSVRASNDDNFVTLRSSGKLSEGVSYSAFARRTRYDALAVQGTFGSDQITDLFDWGIDSGGIKLQGATDAGYLWRVDARGYEANIGRGFEIAPGDFLTGEDRQFGGQLSYSIEDPERGISYRLAYVKDKQRLFDTASAIDIDHLQFEARRELALGENHTLQFGLGYDLIHSKTDFFAGLAVDTLRQNNIRAFISDTWRVPGTNVALTAGLQAIEHEFSGLDIQPSVRASWTPARFGSFWTSVSRAIRTPSIEEEVFGQGTLDNESVIAAEAGWRGRFSDAVSLDVALYHNDYDDVRLRSFDPVTFLDMYTNAGTGSAKGVEVAVDVKATKRWTLRGAWSYHMGQHQPRGEDPDIDFVDSQYPVHLVNLRSYVDLGNAWELDTAAYVVERFDELGGGDGPEYWRGDVRLGWRPKDGVRLAFGVQGVNDSLRSEFGAQEARRLFYVSLDLVR